jgi:WD40 repeat protein
MPLARAVWPLTLFVSRAVACAQALTAVRGHNDWVKALVTTPDGAFLFSAGLDKIVRMWDTATLQVDR